MSKNKTVFETLSTIDVSGFTKELKTGYRTLSYLSWADAWKNLKITYPNASYKVIKDSDTNLPYVGSEVGAMVFTEMTIEGVTHEMWLPVMDNNNQAMKKEAYKYNVKNGEREVKAMTMFDVNTAIMRCLTKNMAMFGLGLNIYTGEDLPLTHEDFLTEEELQQQKEKEALEIEEYVVSIKERIADDDETGVSELKSELSDEKRIVIAKQLTPDEIDYLRKVA